MKKGHTEFKDFVYEYATMEEDVFLEILADIPEQLLVKFMNDFQKLGITEGKETRSSTLSKKEKRIVEARKILFTYSKNARTVCTETPKELENVELDTSDIESMIAYLKSTLLVIKRAKVGILEHRKKIAMAMVSLHQMYSETSTGKADFLKALGNLGFKEK